VTVTCFLKKSTDKNIKEVLKILSVLLLLDVLGMIHSGESI
jgi:hypothetical protein